MPEDDRLFNTRWVHIFEEDTAEGAVYRPEGDNVPLSRRPRERLELSADGTAKIITLGPDDRVVEKPATWASGSRESAGASAPASASASTSSSVSKSAEIQIVNQSPSRLIVRRN